MSKNKRFEDIMGSVTNAWEMTNENNTQTKGDELRPNLSTSDVKSAINKSVGKASKQVMDNFKTSYKCKNGNDDKDNFAITIKIDADIEQYFRNIEAVSVIEAIKSKGEIDIKTTNKKEYINNLIRADMLRTLNISQNETDPNKWIDAYKKYASEYGIKDQVSKKRDKKNGKQ